MNKPSQELDFFVAASSGEAMRDWPSLYRQLGEATLALAHAPAIQADPRARGLVRRLAESKDMEEFDCCVELLGLRVSELLGSGEGVNLFSTKAGRAAPPALNRVSGFDEDGEAPLRTFIRL